MKRLIATAAMVIVAAAGLTACGGGDPKPPSCAKPENQSGLSVSAGNKCMDDVVNWCTKYKPKEDTAACENVVYGYASRESEN